MNILQATSPLGNPDDPADAIGAIGREDKLTPGSGDENNTFGVAALVGATGATSSNKALCALHSMPVQSSGNHTLPALGQPGCLLLRLRRKTDNTVGTIVGGSASYHQVRIASYLVPSPAQDIALLTLAETVSHINPISTEFDYELVEGDTVVEMGGWGSISALPGELTSQPGDVLKISGREISVLDDPYGGGTLFGFPSDEPKGIEWNGTNPGPNIYDSGSPLLTTVEGSWRIIGVIISYGYATGVAQFEHYEDFQIPGLYSPAPTPSQPPSEWLLSDDTFIASGDPTANNSASQNIEVKNDTGKATEHNKAIFNGFELPAYPLTKIQLTLFLKEVSNNLLGAGVLVRVRRGRRINTTDLANYDTYNGTNEWGTSGAENTSTDIYTADEFTFVVPNDTPPFTSFVLENAQLLAMAQAAQTAEEPLSIILDLPTENEGYVIFASAEASPFVIPHLEAFGRTPIPPSGGDVKADGTTVEVLFEGTGFSGFTGPSSPSSVTIDLVRNGSPVQLTAAFDQFVAADILWWQVQDGVIYSTDTELTISGLAEGQFGDDEYMNGEVEDHEINNFSALENPTPEGNTRAQKFLLLRKNRRSK